MEILEPRSTNSEIKNSTDENNSRMEGQREESLNWMTEQKTLKNKIKHTLGALWNCLRSPKKREERVRLKKFTKKQKLVISQA